MSNDCKEFYLMENEIPITAESISNFAMLEYIFKVDQVHEIMQELEKVLYSLCFVLKRHTMLILPRKTLCKHRSK